MTLIKRTRLVLQGTDDELVIPDTKVGIAQALHEWGMSNSPQECGWVITYDNGARVYLVAEVARGSVHHLPIHMPTLLSAVLTSGTDRFMFIHNHPSGELRPSTADLETTEQIAEAAALCGLYFDDHLILTREPKRLYSLAGKGDYIPPKYREVVAERYGGAA